MDLEEMGATSALGALALSGAQGDTMTELFVGIAQGCLAVTLPLAHSKAHTAGPGSAGTPS